MRPESLEEYIRFFRNQALLILTAAVLIGGTAAAFGLRSPRTYAAAVLLDVEPDDRRSSSVLPNIAQIALGGAGSDPALMQTIVRRLQTRALIQRAIADYEINEPDGARRLPPAANLAARVEPSQDAGTRLLRIRVELPETEGGARNAALFANQLAQTLQTALAEESAADHRRETGAQLELIRESRQSAERQLQEIRKQLLEFAQHEGSPAVWTAEFAQWLAREEALLRESRALAAQTDAAQTAFSAAEEQLPNEPDAVVSSATESAAPTRSSLAAQIAALEAEIARAQAEGDAESSPKLLGAQAAKQRLQQMLNETPEKMTSETTGRNPFKERLQTEAFERKAEIDALKEQLQRTENNRQAIADNIALLREQIPEKQARLSELELQSQVAVKAYEQLLAQEGQLDLALQIALKQTRAQGYRVAGIAVVDEARPQHRPTQPKPFIAAAAGLALGLLAGVAAGLLNERRRARRDA